MRRVSFWLAVAGVAILAPLGLQVVATKTSSAGLAQFNSYLKNGGN